MDVTRMLKRAGQDGTGKEGTQQNTDTGWNTYRGEHPEC